VLGIMTWSSASISVNIYIFLESGIPVISSFLPFGYYLIQNVY
jgi:hypothetical protein